MRATLVLSLCKLGLVAQVEVEGSAGQTAIFQKTNYSTLNI